MTNTIQCSKCSAPVECAEGTVRIVCASCVQISKEEVEKLIEKESDSDPLFTIKEIVWVTEMSIEAVVKTRYAGERRFSMLVEPGVSESQIEPQLLAEIHKRAEVFARRTKITNPMIGFKGTDKKPPKTITEALDDEPQAVDPEN